MNKRMINILFAVLAVIILIYYVALGLTVRFNQSMMWVWPLAAAALLFRHVYFARFAIAHPVPHWFVIAVRVAFCVCMLFFLSVEFIIMKAGFTTTPAGLDYIIVLGAKVNGTHPGGALDNRIQVAAEYAQNNPETLIIASGGQGADEGISEAQCIYNGLIERGIDPTRIILEDQSTSTRENLVNSLALINADSDTTIGIVTNDFHIYRSLRLAQTMPTGKWYGVRVATSFISWPHYMMREFAAVVVETLQGVI